MVGKWSETFGARAAKQLASLARKCDAKAKPYVFMRYTMPGYVMTLRYCTRDLGRGKGFSLSGGMMAEITSSDGALKKTKRIRQQHAGDVLLEPHLKKFFSSELQKHKEDKND